MKTSGSPLSVLRKPRLGGVALLLLFSLLALAGWLWFLVAILQSHHVSLMPLFPPDHPFTDFYLYKPTFDVFHSRLFFQPNEGRSGFAYPPLVAPLYRFFYRQHHRFSWYLLLTFLLWGSLLAWLVTTYRTTLRNRKINPALFATALLCYPAVFLLERGNLEIFVWAAVAGGLFAFQRGRSYSAALLFGLAAALKLYPVLLLGLFLGQRHGWRPTLLGAATAVLSTVVAIAYAGPTFVLAAYGFFNGVLGFQQHYGQTVRLSELRFDHSLFAVVKVTSLHFGRSPARFTRMYYLFCAGLASCLFLFRIRRLPWQNCGLFLSTAMLLLPPVSYEYTLVHLYVPLMFLMAQAARTGLQMAGVLLWSDLLLLLLPGNVLDVSSWFQAGQVQSLLLLLALLLTACVLERRTSISAA